MKEFGGFLPLEINKGKEYYEENKLSFNCARSAIKFIVKTFAFDTIYIPVYMCKSVFNALVSEKICIKSYHINSMFEPEVSTIEKNAVIIICNYFGIRSNNPKMIEKYVNVIFDNTQAFFQKPIPGAFNVYSCRKFFGVTDGSYLITDISIKIDEYKKLDLYEPKYANYLLNAITYNTNHAYEESLQNERQLEEGEIYKISSLSYKLLMTIDYEGVKKNRRENYKYIQSRLCPYNELEANLSVEHAPMIYPFLIHRDRLRDSLVDNRIYVPQWWKWILNEHIGNEFEDNLAKYLLPLPIDQRYRKDDMEQMIDIIIRGIEQSE